MQTSGAVMRPMAGSFWLHVFFTLTIYFVPVWFCITFSLLIFKGTRLPYTDAALGMEIFITFLVWFIQYWGVRLGKRGNLTEQIAPLGCGAGLCFVALCGSIYYAWGQTYIMRIDRGFNITLLVLNAINVVMAAATMSGFGPSAPPAMQQQQQQPQQLPPGAMAAAGQQQLAADQQQQQQQQMLQMQQLQLMMAQQQQQQQQQVQGNNANRGADMQQMMLMQQQQQQMQSGGAQPPPPGVEHTHDPQQAEIEHQMRMQAAWQAQQDAAAAAARQ